MNEELLNIINRNKEESIDILCSKYNIMLFQAELIYNMCIQLIETATRENRSDYYIKRFNSIKLGLENGTFLNEETIKNMARGYSKGYLKSENTALSFLEEIGMDKSKIDSFYNTYNNACKYEEQMLSEELDVHALNVQINALLDEAGQLVIQKQNKEKTL